MHHNELLDNDDSSIDCILNGDSIKIIEELDVDSSFCNSLLLKHQKSYKINVYIQVQNGQKQLLVLTETIICIDMIKVYFSKIRIPYKDKNDFMFFYNAELINESD